MLYIGNFLFVTNQQDKKNKNTRRHGSFNMVVEAPDEDKAFELFKDRIDRYRDESSFFEGHCLVYLAHLMEFNRVPNTHAVMLNYKSFAGDPVLPYIECAAPMAQNNACRIHEWDDNHPSTDGKDDQLFMEFKV